MAYRFLIFLGHTLPGLPFFLWGLLGMINNAAGTYGNKKVQQVCRVPIGRELAELFLVIVGSASTLIFEALLYTHVPRLRTYRYLEHIAMTLPFLIYAITGTLVSSTMSKTSKFHFPQEIVRLLGVLAFLQELLLFRSHGNEDIDEIEGRYHALLDYTILACFISSALEIVLPQHSLAISHLKHLAVMLQGSWLIQISLVFTFPLTLLPHGCLVDIYRHHKIECGSHEMVQSAKSMATLRFSWLLSGLTVLTILVQSLASGATANEYFPVGSQQLDV